MLHLLAALIVYAIIAHLTLRDYRMIPKEF